MYGIVKVLDFMCNRFNIIVPKWLNFPKKEKCEQAVSIASDSLQLLDVSSHQVHDSNMCNFDVGEFCTKTSENIAEIEDVIQSVIEGMAE